MIAGGAGFRLMLGALLVLLAASWVLRAWNVYLETGLFTWLGVDFRHYWAQAMALRAGEVLAMYDVQAVSLYTQQLSGWAVPVGAFMESGVANYPPIYPWLFQPLTALNPPLGLLAWTLLNALAALYLAWRVSELLPSYPRPLVVALVLMSLPVVYALWLGNFTIPLAVCVGEAFLSLRQGRDWRAGLWLSLLTLKPQYLILIVPLLLLKRRWDVIQGLAAGGGAIIAASFLTTGWTGLSAYLASLLDKGDLRGVEQASYVVDMVNVRKLVLMIAPGVSDTAGLVLTVVLAALILSLALIGWRGAWEPRSPRFPLQYTMLFAATILATFHSHLYGLSMLAVPLAVLLAEDKSARLTRVTVVGGTLLLTFLFTLRQVPALPATLLLCTLLAMLWAKLARTASERGAVGRSSRVLRASGSSLAERPG